MSITIRHYNRFNISFQPKTKIWGNYIEKTPNTQLYDR